MVRILIVGAGVTGSLCARVIRRYLPTRLQCQIIVWEKSRGVGGRMSLSRAPNFESCSAEVGAQYITQHSKYLESHQGFYEELADYNVTHPLNGTIEGFCSEHHPNYVCKHGLSSIMKHHFARSSVELRTGLRLHSLELISAGSWNVWKASTTCGLHDHFDAVILTMPIPQILSIEGIKSHLNETQMSDLESVEYSSRFAAALFYNGVIMKDIPYVAKYVNDSEIIKYIAIDQKKRGVSSNTTSLVVHTSVPFGKRHLEEDPDTVGPQVLDELKRIMPGLPEPDFVKYHKWRYSQVSKSAESYGSLIVRNKPLLVLAGDGFTHSNFDGCIESALSVESPIKKFIDSIQ